MTALRTWLLGVIAAALLLELAAALFPKGKYQAVGSLTRGLILLLVMVRPLLSAEIPSWEDLSAQMDQQTQQSVVEQQTDLAAVISEKTAAYIQSKAAALGFACRVEVDCTLRDGVPFPTEVWLDAPYHAPLAELIAADLAIDRAHQYWQEGAP